MINDKKDEFKAPIDLNKKELLGKKKLKLSTIKQMLIKDNNIDDSDSDSDQDLKKYKDALSGKFNLKNVLTNKTDLLDTDKNWTPDDYINSKPEIKKTNKNSKINELLLILPQPKNKVYDKTNGLLGVNLTNNEDIKVNLNSNPDEINNFDYNFPESERPIYGNVRDVNLEELVDKNWQNKYLANQLNSEKNDKLKLFEPTKTQKSKHHITSLAYDYLSTQNEEELKKSNDRKRQMKTKGKYGW